DAYLEKLDAAARSASLAEDAYRSEVAERVKSLERARAFSFRRAHLVRVVAASMGGAENEEEAIAAGSAAFLREIGWNGATEAQREVMERFKPVMTALWEMAGDGTAEIKPGIDQRLVAFETWFE